MRPSELITEYKALAVRSAAFADYGVIPSRFTCEGENVNPPLEIGEVPEEARSLALIVEDPDAPAGTWLHWLVWNIPVMRRIPEDAIPGEQGMNDFGKRAYGGPCPPSGVHRYFFKVYALDDLLVLPAGSRRSAVEAAMRDHIVAFGETIGLYQRTGALTL
jgi:Raf kinase inhibitor-like YbhB/YbcL family protein